MTQIRFPLLALTAVLTLASCSQTEVPQAAQTNADLKAQLMLPPCDEDCGGGGGGGGGGYPPPSATVIPDGFNARVRITVKNVYTSNTEDIMGADEFYFAGSLLATAPNNQSKAIPFLMSPPVDINDGQTLNSNMVIFNEVVPKGTNVIGNLQAYDEDAGKDWATVGANFQTAVTTTATALGSSGLPKAALLQSILNAGFGVLDASMKADKDDILGNQGFEYIDATNSGSKNREMHMEKTSRWGWSTWNYYIRYEITVEPTMDALTF